MSKVAYNFTITDAAAKRINQLNNDGASCLRITVDGGGCSGFRYQYSIVTLINEDDFVAVNQGAKVLIDSTSADFMNNSTIDFIIELGSSYFAIRNNPNITEKCGCGNSFSI